MMLLLIEVTVWRDQKAQTDGLVDDENSSSLLRCSPRCVGVWKARQAGSVVIGIGQVVR